MAWPNWRALFRYFAWGAGGVALVIVAPMIGRAQEPKLAADLPEPQQRSLLAEYRQNYERVKELYGNAQMLVVRRESEVPAYKNGKNPEGKRTFEFVYRARHGQLLRLDETTLDFQDESQRESTTVWLARPEGYLIARRETPESPFVAKMVSQKVQPFEWAPYFSFVVAAQRWVFERAAGALEQTVRLEAAQEDGERVATVTVKVSYENGDSATRLVLYRDRAWAVKEATFGVPALIKPNDSVRRCRCEYDGERDGIPLLKRVAVWQEVGPQRQRMSKQDVEIRELQVGPVAEEEFTVAALGIKIGAQRPNWQLRMVLVVGGALLVALYVLLRRRVSRRTAHPG